MPTKAQRVGEYDRFWFKLSHMETPSEESFFRIEQANKLIEFLKRSGAPEFFHSLSGDLERSKDIPFDDFMDFVERLNGIARDIPIKDRGADGENVLLSSPIAGDSTVPRHEDKKVLLEEAYNARLELANKEDVQYMIPLVVNAVHLFEDGNGRTSRVLNVLLSPHNSTKDMEMALTAALGLHGRFDSLDLSPSYISLYVEREVLQKHGFKYESENYFTMQVPEGMTRGFTPEDPKQEKAKEFKLKRKVDFELTFAATYLYLKSKNILESIYVRRQELPEFDLEDDYRALSIKKMEDVLTDEDWQNIIDGYYTLKKEQVEVMIDCFVHPENHKTEEGVTLREAFIKKAISEMESHK